MLTPGADVLVHAITRDDPEKAKTASALLRSDHLLILKTVLCELSLRLRYHYGLSEAQIHVALETVAGLENATIEDAPAVELALLLQGEMLDFVSALNLAQSRNSAHFATFDQAIVEAVRANPDSPRVLWATTGEQV